MSDLTTIAEHIRTAVDVMEEVQQAEEELRTQANHENYEVFRSRMEELIEHLNHLNKLMAHEDEMALDELSDALSRTFHTTPPEYRHAEGHDK